tara:strand:- start:23 stop:325 length:303 start_codon:yes stop_codon:yes gene_type:complete
VFKLAYNLNVRQQEFRLFPPSRMRSQDSDRIEQFRYYQHLLNVMQFVFPASSQENRHAGKTTARLVVSGVSGFFSQRVLVQGLAADSRPPGRRVVHGHNT